MISEEDFAQQFLIIIEQLHPRVWKLLRYCYVKIINFYLITPYIPQLHYVGIYCPNQVILAIENEKNLLREVASYLGFVEVICLNATNLVRDPISKLKQTNPRFWLELHWIAIQEQ